MKKNSEKIVGEKIVDKKKNVGDLSEDESLTGEETAIDPAIIEDTFSEEFSEYNDVDNF